MLTGGWLHAAITPPALSTGPDTTTPQPAPGMLLVARRGFLDPYFSQTVIYLLQHDEQASFGLVVNRALGTRLSERLPETRDTLFASRPLYHGGPVETHLLVMLTRGVRDPELFRHVVDDVYVSINPQALDNLLAEEKPASALRLYLGHAGWVPGQLEQELERDYWHLVETDIADIYGPGFTTLWQHLIEQLEPAMLQDLD